MLSTARDIARWNYAMSQGHVLTRGSLPTMFHPYVEMDDGSSYGYGWVFDSAGGPSYWHDGGNGWTYGELTRIPSQQIMIFWITNQARKNDWNVEDLAPTGQIRDRIRT